MKLTISLHVLMMAITDHKFGINWMMNMHNY